MMNRYYKQVFQLTQSLIRKLRQGNRLTTSDNHSDSKRHASTLTNSSTHFHSSSLKQHRIRRYAGRYTIINNQRTYRHQYYGETRNKKQETRNKKQETIRLTKQSKNYNTTLFLLFNQKKQLIDLSIDTTNDQLLIHLATHFQFKKTGSIHLLNKENRKTISIEIASQIIHLCIADDNTVVEQSLLDDHFRQYLDPPASSCLP